MTPDNKSKTPDNKSQAHPKKRVSSNKQILPKVRSYRKLLKVSITGPAGPA